MQGIDYAYTLQGWLKGVNSAGATDSFNIGGDGMINSPNRFVARDAFGFALNYFGNDYKAIHEARNPFPGYSAHLNTNFRPLYNGNISSMVSTNRIFENPAAHPDSATMLFNYHYDQLNRITGMDVYNKFSRITNSYAGITKLEKFKERVSYDGNGNILKYLRNGNGNGDLSHLRMDSLTYGYYPGTNRLRKVRDSIPANWYGANVADKIIDIDNQTDVDNYIYDSIGNLIQDKAEKITNISWNVYGKITGISRGAGIQVPASEIRYTYDAAGNRISKSVEKGGRKTITWYVRDAQGTVMATYTSDTTAATPLQGFVLNENERYIYGSSRLGVVNAIQPVDNGNAGPAVVIDTGGLFVRGERMYELSNHLGNVLVTISDKKRGVADPLMSSLISHFEPIMLSGTDYYPFGMAMRVGGDSKHKYGFNGKENDNEVKGGEGLQQDYGMRIYDPRLGRFLSVDPLSKQYPWFTPYQYASNIPTRLIDLDGAEGYDAMSEFDNGTTLLNMAYEFKDAVWNIFATTAYPHFQGVAIRRILKNQGFDVGNIHPVHLSQVFDIVAQEGQFKVIAERSFTEKLFTLTFSAITVAGSMPSKGSSPYLAIKINPVVSTAIGDILSGLKLNKAISESFNEIKKFKDPGTGKFLREFEAQSGAILESSLGVKLRELKNGEVGDFAVESGSIGGLSASGKTIDQLGVPKSGVGKFSMDDFKSQVTSHFRKKGVDYVLVDGRNLSESQKKDVLNHINVNHEKDKQRLLTIGF